MEIVLGVAAAAALLAVVVLAARAVRTPASAPARREGGMSGEGGLATVTLDLDVADPESPVVRRLVDEAAARAFATLPDAEEVEVRARTGHVIGRRRRRAPATKEVNLPDVLLEPHARRHGSDLEGDMATGALASSAPATPRFAAREEPELDVPLADHFELPQAVRNLLRDPDDAVEIVRAVLEAGGRQVEVEGDVVRAAGEVVVVVRARVGDVVGTEALNHAYLRFLETRARRGVVVTPGLLYPAEVRRRETLAPALLHAGADGIQRMADAVALGADPMRFAAAPALFVD